MCAPAQHANSQPHGLLCRTSDSQAPEQEASDPIVVVAGSNDPKAGNQDERHVVLALPSEFRLSSIQVQACAKDQGFCSDPSRGSWTWLEIGWLTADDQEHPAGGSGRLRVYTNALQRGWQQHDILLDDARFLAHRPPGDAKLALWVRSQYTGWRHWVQDITMTAQ
jgi:hypothetical protein